MAAFNYSLIQTSLRYHSQIKDLSSKPLTVRSALRAFSLQTVMSQKYVGRCVWRCGRITVWESQALGGLEDESESGGG